MPLTFPVPPKTDQPSAVRNLSLDIQGDIAVFRSCYQRFQECLQYRDLQSPTAFLELAKSYILDFDLTAKRAIGDQISRYRLFQLRYLNGTSRQECCKALELDVFTYTSESIQLERLIGHALVQRGLFPFASYFDSSKVKLKIAA